MRRTVMVAATILVATAVGPATSAAGGAFPEVIPVPSGSYPEGIAIGRGHTGYVGSLLDGSIYTFDLRSGAGEVLVPGQAGRATIGMEVDDRSGLLWAVGLQSGEGRLFAFDARTGAQVAEVPVAGAFLNDLAVTRTAVHVTDSFADVLWTVPLDNRGLPSGAATALPLVGDFTLVQAGPLPVNLNGLVATPDGRWLLSCHTSLGVLYRIDPTTGEATEIDLGGDLVPSGDGLVLVGHTLYVVQNFLNMIGVVDLAPDLATGTVGEPITSDAFRVPTTAAVHGNGLYAVNARFDEGFPPIFGGPVLDLDYEVVRVTR